MLHKLMSEVHAFIVSYDDWERKEREKFLDYVRNMHSSSKEWAAREWQRQEFAAADILAQKQKLAELAELNDKKMKDNIDHINKIKQAIKDGYY